MNNRGTMEHKNKILPELRFPEFVKDGEWKGEKLGVLSDIIIGGTPSTVVEEYWNGNIGWIGSGEIKNDIIKFPTKYITELGFKKSSTYLLPKGTTVLAMTGATLGKIGFLDQEFCGNQSVAGFINLKNLNSKFLFYQLLNETKQILSFAGGGAQAGINKSNIECIVIQVPKNADNKNKEQQKIADCLSSLDELITAHTNKLETLNNHKKGLLQNLFPREGQKLPNYRFPEFLNDGEWVEKKLGDLAENLDSKRIPITSNQREKGSVPYYGASGVIDYVKEYIFDETLLCISEDGANLIDRNYPIAFTISGKTWVNNHAHVLRFEKHYTHIVVEKYVNSINVQDFLTGMAQPKLNRGKLDIIPIPLPKNNKEQKKIAEYLATVDYLILAQTEKIEQLKTHKKGLMQGLFPKINA